MRSWPQRRLFITRTCEVLAKLGAHKTGNWSYDGAGVAIIASPQGDFGVLVCIKKFRLGQWFEGFDHIYDRKIPPFLQVSANLAVSCSWKHDFFRDVSVRSKEMLHNCPALIENLHKGPVVRERTDYEIFTVIFLDIIRPALPTWNNSNPKPSGRFEVVLVYLYRGAHPLVRKATANE